MDKRSSLTNPLTTIMADSEFRDWFSHQILKQQYISVFDDDTFAIWQALSRDQQGDVMRLYLLMKNAKGIANQLLEIVPALHININQLIADSINLVEHHKDLIKGIIQCVTLSMKDSTAPHGTT